MSDDEKSPFKHPLMERIGLRMKNARLQKRWRQWEVAAAAGVTEDTYRAWELGKNLMPCVYLLPISRALDCPIEYFFAEGEADDEQRREMILRSVVRLLE